MQKREIRMATMDEVAALEKEQHNPIMEEVYEVLRKHMGVEESVYFVLVVPGVTGASVMTDASIQQAVELFQQLGRINVGQ